MIVFTFSDEKLDSGRKTYHLMVCIHNDESQRISWSWSGESISDAIIVSWSDGRSSNQGEFLDVTTTKKLSD